MNQDTILKITELFKADEAKAKEILLMDPKAAAEAITNMGCEVSEEELKQIGEALQRFSAQNQELKDSELEQVAGGGWWQVGVGALAGVSATAVGLAVLASCSW